MTSGVERAPETKREVIRTIYVAFAFFLLPLLLMIMVANGVDSVAAYLIFVVACILARGIIRALTWITLIAAGRWPLFFTTDKMPSPEEMSADIPDSEMLGCLVALVVIVASGVVWGVAGVTIAMWCSFFAAAVIMHGGRWIKFQLRMRWPALFQ